MSGRDEELGRLPAGRHGYTPEEVAHSQRERLLAAVVEVIDEHGYNAATVRQIHETASVSRRVFYYNFADKQACFLAAFEIVVEHLHQQIVAAAADQPDWPHRAIAGLGALIHFLEAEPKLARLLLVESVSAEAEVAARFRDAVASFAPFLRAGRAERPKAAVLPGSTEDSLLGAVASVLRRAVATGQPLEVTRLHTELAEFILTPYIGARRAAKMAEEAAAVG